MNRITNIALAIAASLSVFALASSASAQSPIIKNAELNCDDYLRADYPREACQAEDHAERLQLYGLEPIETFAASKTLIVRTFITNTLNRNIIAVSFVRALGQSPQVDVRMGKQNITQVSGPISGKHWDDAWKGAAFFDRDLTPPPPPPPSDDGLEFITVCADGRTMIVEMVDHDGNIRRKTGHECDEDLVTQYNQTLIDIAAEALPQCADLHLGKTDLGLGMWQYFTGSLALLHYCSVLDGDIPSASLLANHWPSLINNPDHYYSPDLQHSIWAETKITLQNGAIVSGSSALEDALAQLDQDIAAMWPNQITGLSPTRTSINGGIVLKKDQEKGLRCDPIYPFAMEWVFDVDEFRLASLVIGSQPSGETCSPG